MGVRPKSQAFFVESQIEWFHYEQRLSCGTASGTVVLDWVWLDHHDRRIFVCAAADHRSTSVRSGAGCEEDPQRHRLTLISSYVFR